MNKPLILVVEDDTPVRNLITTTLKAHDYRFLTAANGESAVLEASSHNPDIILLDLGLPDMDGVEVTRRIRREVGDDIPIVMISAYDISEVEEEARAAGVNGFLPKPLYRSSVYAAIKDALEKKGQPSEAVEQKHTDMPLTGM